MMIFSFVFTVAAVAAAGIAICSSDESDKAARALADMSTASRC